jgi:3-oxoacyl-[acyl-carrier-protein] synthase-3
MSVAIVGIGTWLPEKVRRNQDWPAGFAERRHDGDRTFNDIPTSEDPIAAAILERDLALEATDPFLGAVERRVAEDSVSAHQAETWAARAALDDAGIDGADVDVLVSYAIVPDQVGPSGANWVAHALGARRAVAYGVDVACAAAVTQLDLARAYLESGSANVVLLTQSHLLLRATPMMHPASPGLGDVATAMVVTREERGLQLRSTFQVTHGQYAPAVLWMRGHTPVENTPWFAAGGPFILGSGAPAMTKELMRETVAFGAATVREATARAAVDVERLALLASVQPRGFVPGAIAERLGLPRERAVTSYAEIAHVGACGPVFNLARARSLGRIPPCSLIALYAQGAGFTRAAAILESYWETKYSRQ